MEFESLHLRPFAAVDFPAYRSWFADPHLNRVLGPIDEEWLRHVLYDDRGQQFSAFAGGNLVGVGGVLPPANNFHAAVITDLAVKPDLRGQRIGSALLRGLLTTNSSPKWTAYVAENNPAAGRFLRKNGWSADGVPDEAGMLTYRFDR